MNRKVYLEQLKFALQGMPNDELQDILYDYEEHFDIGLSKGKSEAEISNELGDPQQVANNYKIISNPANYDKNYNKNNNYSNDNTSKIISKKILPILAGVTIVVFGVGLLYLMISNNYRPGNFMNIMSIDGVVKSETIDKNMTEGINGVNSISAITSFVDIKIIPQERDDVRIYYHGSIISNIVPDLNVTKELNNLKIELKTRKNIFTSVRKSDLVLEIFVPTTFDGSYNITSSSGDIDISDLKGEKFNINASSGDIDISNLKGEEYNIYASSGDIDISNLKGEEYNINASSGDIDVKNINGETLNIVTSSGNINAQNCIGYLYMTSSSGDIILDLENTSGNIDLSTSSGDMTLKLSDKSNYAVTGSTSSGTFKSNIPMTIDENKSGRFKGTIGSGDKYIKISTSSGDVRFDKR
ncbi:DUF4097 family beta strand repeat-containing protein [Alkaliphilus sp. B6464]|uniref:DUF4097 family beta strand repeat-containing protein n=1 Tax=Alkaliphilus sp. B6464 TaxID=2731219 RepID=UPI001BA7F03C|nr:DUF4097 family beta strand repeat-containing protein [Alkaliphilus sp. B6464]QUH21000.1 DUF4097 family beta strand repeat protein [Alkaliphilus sp. B6464]